MEIDSNIVKAILQSQLSGVGLAHCGFLLLVVTGMAGAQPPLPSRDSTIAALKRDLTYLASPALAGRATGSPGVDSAAQYLAKRYVSMMADAVLKTKQCDSAGDCRRTYFQPFRPPAYVLARAGIDTLAIAFNIVASAEGFDTTLSRQWLVVGAHYDHLGRTGYGARDRTYATEPHLGADDNASGTAAILELARRFVNLPMRRPVLFVNFGSEELGEFGSSVFVENAPFPPDSMVAMFNFDMVGHLRGGKVQLYGLGSSGDWSRVIDRANAEDKLALDRHSELDPRGSGSDHDNFARAGVPVVHFFTGTHSAYHTKDDTVEQIDFDGMTKVIDFAEHVIRLVGDGAVRPARAPKALSDRRRHD